MPTLDLYHYFLHALQVYTGLRDGNGGGGFEGHIKLQGHTIGNATQNTPATIGCGLDVSVF